MVKVTLIKGMVDWEYKCLICVSGALGAGHINFWHLVYSLRNTTFLSGLLN